MSDNDYNIRELLIESATGNIVNAIILFEDILDNLDSLDNPCTPINSAKLKMDSILVGKESFKHGLDEVNQLIPLLDLIYQSILTEYSITSYGILDYLDLIDYINVYTIIESPLSCFIIYQIQSLVCIGTILNKTLLDLRLNKD